MKLPEKLHLLLTALSFVYLLDTGQAQYSWCSDNLSITSDISDTTYYIGETTVLRPGYSNIDSGYCGTVARLYFYDDYDHQWVQWSSSDSDYDFVSSFSTSNGQLEINTYDYDTYDPVGGDPSVYRTKINIYTYDSSYNELSGAIDYEFDLTLYAICRDTTVSLDSSQGQITYYIGSG